MLSTSFLPLLKAKCHFSPAFLINSLPTLIVTSTHKISVAASGFPLGCHAIGLFVIVWGSARRGVMRQRGGRRFHDCSISILMIFFCQFFGCDGFAGEAVPCIYHVGCHHRYHERHYTHHAQREQARRTVAYSQRAAYIE